MGVLFWLLFGVLVGGLSVLLTPSSRTAGGVTTTVVLGALGALLGGFTGRALGLYPRSSTGGAIGMAVLGAVVLLALYHAVFARRQVY